ncbi:MAG TPA: hypothetical protein VG368_07025, partial [Acidimicrobiales bacterium]|nr:hypothetical protein [Acidimicrobiales bacterium]
MAVLLGRHSHLDACAANYLQDSTDVSVAPVEKQSASGAVPEQGSDDVGAGLNRGALVETEDRA